LTTEYTSLWNSLNLEILDLANSNPLVISRLSFRKSFKALFLDLVAKVCKRIARFTLSTNLLYGRTYLNILPQFLSTTKVGGLLEVV